MKKNAAILRAKLLKYRHTGIRGTPIVMHRALRKITLSYSAIATIVLLPLFFDGILWMGLDSITKLWAGIFDFWIHRLKLDGQVLYVGTQLLGKQLSIPYPDLPTSIPSQLAIYNNIVYSLLLFALVHFIPKNYLPAIYVLRTALLIQLSASFYYIIHPGSNPYELMGYISGMLTLGLYVMLLASPLLAMIYYIFDFPFRYKLTATLLMVGYFLIVLPFQYMLHALIISSGSMLLMPVLYLLFGALLSTLMFVSLYGWMMTWGQNTAVLAVPIE